MNAMPLKGLRVMLSAALPDELAGTVRAQKLYDLLVVLSRALAAAGAHLVFGGHPSITPLINRAASRQGLANGMVTLYQAARFRSQAPEAVFCSEYLTDVRWIGSADDGRATALTALRQAMAADADAAIFVGGRGRRPDTPVPGLREEYQQFCTLHPESPIYLLGLLDGEALKMIQEVEQGQLLEPNGLTEPERQLVHHSDMVELCVALIRRDLQTAKPDRRRNSNCDQPPPPQG